MKLIVGLGNPGEKYRNNRHNVGFTVIDEIAKALGVTNFKISKKGKAEYGWGEAGKERIELYKPQTFMNDSGLSVSYVLKKHQDLDTSHIYVIHDDLDIPFGSFKIQFGKGPKEHKGLASIDKALGTQNYWHVRVGVDARKPENRIPGEEYVLGNFTNEELENLRPFIKEIASDLLQNISQDISERPVLK